jgi:DNA-binding SARP family transcriptional activator
VRSALLRLPSLLAAAVALGVLAALARFRPEFPETPDSLSSPVTTAFLQALALVAAWLLAALVVLLLLVESLRAIRASRQANLDGANLPARMLEPARLRRPASTHGLFRPLIDEPRLLVVEPPEVPAAPPEEQGDGSSSKPAAGAVAEPDLRPLISLLGPLTIHGGERSRRGLRARALELIAFLALRRGGAQRDEILEALWPGDDPKRSRHRLYQAVRDARRLLGEAVASERDRYWLDRNSVRVDVDVLDELLEEARQAGSGEHIDELLEKALTLFRAEPLAGSDYVWLQGEPRRLRVTYVELLRRVGHARLETGDAEKSLEAAERGLAVDLLDEDLWRLALEAEGALGLREAIEERYGRLRDLLQDRLALEPAKETRALYLRLLGQS